MLMAEWCNSQTDIIPGTAVLDMGDKEQARHLQGQYNICMHRPLDKDRRFIVLLSEL